MRHPAARSGSRFLAPWSTDTDGRALLRRNDYSLIGLEIYLRKNMSSDIKSKYCAIYSIVLYLVE